MHRKVILVALFFLAFPSIALPQSNSDDPEIPAVVKSELRAFTKRFAKRFQQTRDLEPLVRSFFVSGFENYCKHFFDSESENKQRYIPTKQEIRMVCINSLNFFYVFGLTQILDPDRYDFVNSRIFPQVLRKQLKRAMDKADKLDTAKTQREFRSALSPIVAVMRTVRRHLKRKNYETSNKYNNAVADLEKDQLYNYPVTTIFDEISEDSDDDWVKWLQRFGPETKAYSVGTPFGYALMIVKTRNGLRAFGLWAHPGSD